MKISSEQLKVLQEQELRKKPGVAAGNFDEILALQMDPAQGAGKLTQTGLAPRVAAPAALEGILEDSAPDTPALMQEAVDRMEGMFNTLDSYAAQIGSGNQDMRQAYGLLQNMGQQVADFKARFPNAEQEQPALAAMLNEVDVLFTTETFKFNRGDYV